MASPVLGRLRGLRCLVVRCLENQQPHSTYFTQLTALTELTLELPGNCSVPEGLGGMKCRHWVCIVGGAFRDLPAGLYLRHLKCLRMCECNLLEGVPSKLAAATQLRRLELKYSRGVQQVTWPCFANFRH